MIERIIITSLMITGLFKAFQEGNILSFIRAGIATELDYIAGKRWSKYIQKPLWDCLPCMGSLWAIILTWSFNIPLILAVCGLNVIINCFVDDDEEKPCVTGLYKIYPPVFKDQNTTE